MDHPANLPACLTIKKIDEKDANKKKRVVLLIELMKSWHNGTRSWRQQSDTNALSFLAWKPIFIKNIKSRRLRYPRHLHTKYGKVTCPFNDTCSF